MFKILLIGLPLLFGYLNVYCPECPPWGTIGHRVWFLPFGHGRDLAAFKGTGLQNKSFQDRAEISIRLKSFRYS